MRRWIFTIAALAPVVSAVLAGSAAAAPKPIVFSGTLEGMSVDVGRGETGDTFLTTEGTFTATTGLKGGVYSSSFTLGAVTFPIPVIREFAVTGTFTLRTNGGTITAMVIPTSSAVRHGPTPSQALTRQFVLELQVVAGTGRFKKMTGTLEIVSAATACGWPPSSPPEPPCPDIPFGSDPILDWLTQGTLTGTLVRETGPSFR